MDSGEHAGGDHLAQNLDGIVLDDAQIGQFPFGDQFAEVADPRRVHFDAQIVDFGVARGDFRRSFAHAETDFDDTGRTPPENLGQIDLSGGVGDADARQHRFAETLLTVRQPALAQNETANVMAGGLAAVVAVRRGVRPVGHDQEPIRPLVGDEGSAE